MAVNRLTGFSGFDTDKMISDLMKIEQTKIDKVKQSQQYKVWEQESYRDTIKSIQSLQDGFFDILNPDSNLRSTSMFAKFSSEIKIGSTTSTAVSATGTADASNLQHTINSITQLATKDSWTGSAESGISGVKSQALDFGAGKPAIFQVSLSIDGTAKTITLGMAAINDVDTFVTELNSRIESAFGSNYADVISKEGADAIKFNKSGSVIKVISSGGYEDVMTWMDISSGAASTDYKTQAIGDVLGVTDTDLDTMTIDGTALSSLGISTTTTFEQALLKINNGNLGVKVSFSSLNDRFKFESTSEGVAGAMTLSADLKTAFGLDSNTVAQDAMFELDGVSLVKSQNTFTVEGVSYTLKETYDGSGGDIDVNLNVDSSAIKEQVKSFIKEYNNIVKTINDKLNEKTYRDYKPLTDDEKESMSEEQITLWETKAKSGLLRNSSELESMLSKMRQAIYEDVEGAGISMAEIGISTSSNYKDKGKLVLDESKLTTALETRYDQVVKLFTSESDKDYLESGTATERYTENGIGNRLYDILRDNIRTSRDPSTNKKGVLLEKAGVESDASFYNNTLTTSILQYESRINVLLEAYSDKEDYYYLTFSRMESALNQMNNQASWLSSQLGTS